MKRRDVLKNAFNCFSWGLGKLSGMSTEQVKARVITECVPVKTVSTESGDLKFTCPSKEALFHVATFHVREPETLNWIRAMKPQDILWDIGANIGTFTLYAALRRVNVVAFEPSAFNFAVLMENIKNSGFDERIQAFCVALSKSKRLDKFYMQYLTPGAAKNSFGKEEWHGGSYTSKFKQATMGFTVDDFRYTFNVPCPTHIKLDVDGIEEDILKGAVRTLALPWLESIIVELPQDVEAILRVTEMLGAYGFMLQEVGNRPDVSNYVFWREKVKALAK